MIGNPGNMMMPPAPFVGSRQFGQATSNPLVQQVQQSLQSGIVPQGFTPQAQPGQNASQHMGLPDWLKFMIQQIQQHRPEGNGMPQYGQVPQGNPFPMQGQVGPGQSGSDFANWAHSLTNPW